VAESVVSLDLLNAFVAVKLNNDGVVDAVSVVDNDELDVDDMPNLKLGVILVACILLLNKLDLNESELVVVVVAFESAFDDVEKSFLRVASF